MILKARLSPLPNNRYLAPVLKDLRVTVLPRGSPPRTHPNPWTGVIDTGADISAAPLEILESLGAVPIRWGRLISAVHSSKKNKETKETAENLALQNENKPALKKPIYSVQLLVPQLPAVELEMFGLERSYFLLGRDFLKEQNLIFLMNNVVSAPYLVIGTPDELGFPVKP